MSRYFWEDNWPIFALFGLLAALIVTMVRFDHAVHLACYSRGYEYENAHLFDPTTYCIEQIGATRKVIAIQR